jgi:hypothetical protein
LITHVYQQILNVIIFNLINWEGYATDKMEIDKNIKYGLWIKIRKQCRQYPGLKI